MAKTQQVPAPEKAPVLMAQGSFALWLLPDGSLMFAANVPDGEFAGEHKKHLPKAVLKVAEKLLGGKLFGKG